MRASVQLLMYQHSIIGSGTPALTCVNRCEGKTASNRNHHHRTGDNNNAANMIEFGGQSVETGCGWKVKANPIFAPTK
jgi:hypothetical protein